jgi:hypothetical protein
MDKAGSKKESNGWARLNISTLEADVAYFDARLALLEGQPDSYHREAQIKAYQELEQVLSGMLLRLQGCQSRVNPVGGPEIEGVEVSEEWLEGKG